MTVRILYFACFALLATATLALYQTSERTRIAKLALARTEQNLLDEQLKRGALQARYEHLASPDRVQVLAETSLGMSDTATVRLASLTMLPRRGSDEAIRQAAAEAVTEHAAQVIPIAAAAATAR